METKLRQQNARIPAYALPYLINGDASGLSDEDKTTIDKWLNHWVKDAEKLGGAVIISPTGQEEEFTHYPEFGLPCGYIECDIVILAPETSRGR
jgi:hypothetical protein